MKKQILVWAIFSLSFIGFVNAQTAAGNTSTQSKSLSNTAVKGQATTSPAPAQKEPRRVHINTPKLKQSATK